MGEIVGEIIPDMSVHLLRKECGLPPITHQVVMCRMNRANEKNFGRVVCENKFPAQFIGSRQVDHYCNRCRYQIEQIKRSSI